MADEEEKPIPITGSCHPKAGFYASLIRGMLHLECAQCGYTHTALRLDPVAALLIIEEAKLPWNRP